MSLSAYVILSNIDRTNS